MPSPCVRAGADGGGPGAGEQLGEDGGRHPGPRGAEGARGGHQRGPGAQRQVRPPLTPRGLSPLTVLTHVTHVSPP